MSGYKGIGRRYTYDDAYLSALIFRPVMMMTTHSAALNTRIDSIQSPEEIWRYPLQSRKWDYRTWARGRGDDMAGMGRTINQLHLRWKPWLGDLSRRLRWSWSVSDTWFGMEVCLTPWLVPVSVHLIPLRISRWHKDIEGLTKIPIPRITSVIS